jgi:hypothetical protein
MLDTNESLISLDLRENPGFDLPLSKEIFDKLVRNIKLFKQGRMNQPEQDHQVHLVVEPKPSYDEQISPMEQVYN